MLKSFAITKSEPYSTQSARGNVLTFLLPALGLLKVEVGGELYINELILIGLLPFLYLWPDKPPLSKYTKNILLIGVFWLFAQVFTDVYRTTPLEDYIRGWAKISFFLLSFATLSVLINTGLRAFLWLAGSALALFVRPFQLFSLDLDPLILWKYGIGLAVLTTCMLPSLWRLISNPSSRADLRHIAYVHIAIGVISFFLNARSLAGLSVLTGLSIFYYSGKLGVKITMRSLISGCLTAMALGFLLVALYSTAASNGYLGEDAQYKYEMQNAYGGGVSSVLLGGRSEGLVSTVAISDSPWLGHGSWAKDFRYLEMYIDMRKAFVDSEAPVDAVLNEGLIPSHSYLLGAWVESGIVGGAFWIFVLTFCIFVVYPAAVKGVSFEGACAIILIPTFLWNVLFSPFGANVRVDVAGFLAIFILASRQKIVERSLV